MEQKWQRVLLVSCANLSREKMCRCLLGEGHTIDATDNYLEALGLARQWNYAIVFIAIIGAADMALAFFQTIKETLPGATILILGEATRENEAVEMMSQGAYDFLKLPCEDMGLFSLMVGRMRAEQRFAFMRQ